MTSHRRLLSVASLCYVALIAFIFSSCSTTKYLKEGQTFYAGSEIKFESQGKVSGKTSLRKDLETYFTPKPNTKILGMRPGVWFYYKAGTPKKEKGGLKNFIKKKLGQPPVLITDATPERTAKLLSGKANNEGYFGTTATSSIVTNEKKKQSKIIYTLKLYPAYHLKNINYPNGRDSTYAHIMRTLHEKSLLKPRQRYQLERLEAEQERIEAEVENFGFYYFDDRYLIFEADSTVGKKEIDLDLKLEKGIPARARRIFKLNDISIYPNYTLSKDTTLTAVDTTKVGRFNYIDDKHSFRPGVITRVVNLHKGDIYTRDAEDLTLSHLMDLGVFKFVNIKFTDVSNDSAKLDAHIYLTPLKRNSLRAEFQAVSKSNNFVGPGLQVTFTNRNLLRGAELFELRASSSYEVQISRKIGKPLNSFELGLEGVLTVPRFITPFRVDYSSKKYLPKTLIRAGVNLQNRVQYFRLNSFNLATGYKWKETASRTHELYPIDINYVKTDKTSPEFKSLLEKNSFLASSFEDQFIVGSRYTFTLNTQLTENPMQKYEERKYKTHSFFFTGNLDVAGNTLNAIQKQAHKGVEGPFQLLGAPYSQYVKSDIDYRYYLQFDEHNKIATRTIIGAGYAFGNSTTMPYIKQFSIGGSNSIRAFPARTIGPGTYDVRSDTTRANGNFFIDQRADIKLEGNIEFRFDIIKQLKGAVFVDAGNIWLWRKDEEDRPGGAFDRKDFIRELAVGTGVGIRIDFSFFVLRFDTAFPLRKPYLPDHQRWVVNDVNFGSSEWRRENIIFNIGIGYPF